MITRWDDYFIHQTPYPILQPFTDSPNWIDRFYWQVQATSAACMFGVGLGQYRTTGRMDAIAYMLHGSEQRILRLARHTTASDYADASIGPLKFEIVEPLKEWRLRLDDNPSGVTWDLTFNAHTEPVEFRQFEFDDENGAGTNHSHFVQLGKSEGSVAIDGSEIAFGTLLTTRDRSWGVRRPREGQGLLLWLHHQFSEVDISLVLVEGRDGSISYFDGVARGAEGERRLVGIGHDLDLAAGTRDVRGGRLELQDTAGRIYQINYRERLLAGYVGGIGYGGWQGQDRGTYFAESEVLDMSRPADEILATQPMHLFAHLMRVTLDDGEETVADLEGGISRSRNYKYCPRPLGPDAAS